MWPDCSFGFRTECNLFCNATLNYPLQSFVLRLKQRRSYCLVKSAWKKTVWKLFEHEMIFRFAVKSVSLFVKMFGTSFFSLSFRGLILAWILSLRPTNFLDLQTSQIMIVYLTKQFISKLHLRRISEKKICKCVVVLKLNQLLSMDKFDRNTLDRMTIWPTFWTKSNYERYFEPKIRLA